MQAVPAFFKVSFFYFPTQHKVDADPMERIPKELRHLRACLLCSMIKVSPEIGKILVDFIDELFLVYLVIL